MTWDGVVWKREQPWVSELCTADRMGLMNHVITHLQQHLPAVHAHGVHGAEGHEGDGDGRRGVHRMIVTAQQAHKIMWLTDIINSTEANMEAEAHSLDHSEDQATDIWMENIIQI